MADFTPVIDASQSAEPLVVSAEIAGSASVLVHRGRLFASSYSGELAIHDLLVPSAPRKSDDLTTYWSPGDTQVVGGVAFVAAGESGLRTVEVAEGEEPTEIGAMAVPGVVTCVSVAGGHAYVGTLDSGLHVADVTDPARPRLVGSYQDVADVWDIELQGNSAYLAAADAGLVILDVGAPGEPELQGRLDGLEAIGVDVVGSMIYVASPSHGLVVARVEDPTRPTVAAIQPIDGVAQAVSVRGALVHLAALDTGLWLFRLRPDLAPGALYLPTASQGVPGP
jgi:hypothetical protein